VLSDNCVVTGGTISIGNAIGVHFTGSNNRVSGIQLGPSVTTPYTEVLGATGNSFSSSPATDIEAGPSPVAKTATSVAGTFKVGYQLAVTPATWDTGGLTVVYNWFRDGVPIAAATNRTYRTYDVIAEDAGHTLQVVMHVSKAGLHDAESAAPVTPVIAVGAPLQPTAPPTVGNAVVGKYITADRGSWTASPTPKTVTHEWFLNGRPTGVASTSFKLLAADAGKKYFIRVTAKRPGYADGVIDSATVTVLAAQ
jgi:hypothetical protein